MVGFFEDGSEALDRDIVALMLVGQLGLDPKHFRSVARR